jgi:hypothetical protein
MAEKRQLSSKDLRFSMQNDSMWCQNFRSTARSRKLQPRTIAVTSPNDRIRYRISRNIRGSREQPLGTSG